MSRYHVPVPDYDFTIRQKNPYIPTPDYTLKYTKPKNRPSLNSIGTEFAPPEIYESELPPITIPVEVPPQFPKEPSFQHPKKLNRQTAPRLPDENFNYPEIKKHSYIEDHDTTEERHISTKEHIKQIGVPVLPGIATPLFQAQQFEAAPVASDQNRAFLRHLENHKKFDDTLQGDRGIDDCEICQIMRKQLEAESHSVHPGHHSWEAKREQHVQAAPKQNSNPGTRKKRADVRDVFSRIEEETREPEVFFRAISATARHNYEMKRDCEVSIHAMEKVDILHMDQGFALCRKADNTIGWIPAAVFEL